MCFAIEWEMFLRIKQDSANGVVIAAWLSAKIK